MTFKRTKIREWEYSTALDNHDPPRAYHAGTLTEWAREESPDSPTMVLEPDSPFHKLHTKAPGGISFILDDGNEAVPYYATGWNPTSLEVFLGPFPVNPDKRTRPDGRVIDYSNWMLGPRKTYHLKIFTRDT